ncbi:fungal-specific transcription factor domain-containing protein [Trichoderma velutinum]
MASPLNACKACRNSKRKCNRILPICSTCLRFGRLCVYEGNAGQNTTHSIIPEVPGSNRSSLTILNATFGTALQKEARSILGTPDEVHQTANVYFSSIHHRLPIISESRFHENLPRLFVPSGIDFTTLCLCMKLIQQNPVQQNARTGDITSPHYLVAKSSIGFLEAAGFDTLDAIQSRLLLVLYEIGHGIYPAASVSIGSCARLARNVGLGRDSWRSQDTDVEEKKRTWWAVHNLDRFTALCGGDAIFASDYATTETHLPSNEKQVSTTATSEITAATISTPAPFHVGPFARECQVAHLIGRVIQHVYHPITDVDFRSRERAQLERTLKAFLPILIDEELEFSTYCGALGMCISSLYALYIPPAIRNGLDNDWDFENLEIVSTQMAALSQHLVKSAEDESNLIMMSHFIPYALYQTAAIQLNLYRRSQNLTFKANAESIIQILTYMSRRWHTAAKYLTAIELGNPPMTLPPQGFYLSVSSLDTDSSSQWKANEQV